MKKGQVTEEQIVRIMQHVERGEQSIGAICREYGIAENTCAPKAPGWRQKFGGLRVTETQRLRERGPLDV